MIGSPAYRPVGDVAGDRLGSEEGSSCLAQFRRVEPHRDPINSILALARDIRPMPYRLGVD
jgi:hypothetical protein